MRQSEWYRRVPRTKRAASSQTTQRSTYLLNIFFLRTHSARHCIHSRSMAASSSAETIDEPDLNGSRCAVHFLICNTTTARKSTTEACAHRVGRICTPLLRSLSAASLTPHPWVSPSASRGLGTAQLTVCAFMYPYVPVLAALSSAARILFASSRALCSASSALSFSAGMSSRFA